MPTDMIGHEEFERRAGVTYRQLDYWTRKGFLRSSNGEVGVGHRREWPASEARVGRLMVRLVRAGFKVPDAERIARVIYAGTDVHRLAPGVTITIGPED